MTFEVLAPWLVVLACLISEAFFAASELSIISANTIRLEERTRSGSKGEQSAAERTLWFRSHPDRLFATTLLGTNFSTVTGSTVASLTMMKIDPDYGELYALALMSPLVLIGAEIIPKTIAQAQATTLAPRLSGPLMLVHRLLTVPIWVIRGYARLLYRWLGLEGVPRAMISREELVLLMEQEDPHSEIEEGEREMIARIMSFGDLNARAVMIPLVEVCGISQESTIREAAALLVKEGYSRLPVFHERIDDVVGVLHHTDLLSADDGAQTVERIMRPPHFVPETQALDDILIILQRSAASLAIVVDEFGGAVGILTLEDLLEEIVGEINDEFDHGDHVWRQVSEGVYLVQARAPVSRLNEELSLDLPESEDYETLAGHLLEQFKRIPRRGESVTTERGIVLEVSRVSPRAIEEIKVILPGYASKAGQSRNTGEHRRV
ncbi:MAG: hemolysin family protein [Bradymonadia bacterium]